MLGLFEDPFRRIDEKREQSRSMLPKSRALAREAGRKSIVLLKNDGDLLPLPKSGKKIALIGPFAAGQHDLIGPWCVYGDDAKAVDLATGVRAAVADKNDVIIAEGSGVEEPLAGGIEQAVAAAQQADIVVLAIGEAQNMSGEAQSRTEIVVPKPQQELAEAVAKLGKPTVVVLKHGRALALEGRGRQRAGDPRHLVPRHGDRPFDRRRPVRRLQPVGPPAGELPAPLGPAALLLRAQAHRPSQSGPASWSPTRRASADITNTALYPFGHGLTYGKIEYSDFTHQRPSMGMNGEITVTRPDHQPRPAHGRGSRAALHPRPRREHHAAGPRAEGFPQGQARSGPVGSRPLHAATPANLQFYGVNNQPVVEPGTFDVWIAPSAEAEGVRGSFDLTA